MSMTTYNKKKTNKYTKKENLYKAEQPKIYKAVSSLNKKIKNIEKNQELRFIDYTTTLQNVSLTGNLYLLNGSTQGDTPDDKRQGSDITVTSLQMRYHVYPGSDPAASPTEVRVIVFWDKQANSSFPTILRTVGTNGVLDDSTIAQPVHSPYSRMASSRYKILYDKVHVMNATAVRTFNPATGATTNMSVEATYVSVKIPCKRIVKYTDTGNSGTQADIISNSLWLLTIGSDPLESANFYCGSRVYFKDD